MNFLRKASVWGPLLVAACSSRGDEVASEGNFASNQAVLYTFDFDGSLEVESFADADSSIQAQLLYTIGQINGDLRGVGRLDKAKISNLASEALANGHKLVRYHAALPVAVGSKASAPKAHSFRLPRDMSEAGKAAFTKKYTKQNENDGDIRCAAWEGHALSAGNFWYYYRPNQDRCKLEAADITVSASTIVSSTENRTQSYPEYDKIWEDNELSVVAIYGRYEDGSKSNQDPTVTAYINFSEKIKNGIGVAAKDWKLSKLDPATMQLVPLEKIPTVIGNETPMLTWQGTRFDGRRVRVDTLLTDGSTLQAQRPTERGYDAVFNGWYNQRSKEADLIVYTGHAGLGANVRALTRKGTFAAGKYQIVFMDGCDTFAYVDGYMAKEKARINNDDPNGTKYLDMLTTLMPTVPSWTPDSFTNLISGLSQKTPLTYTQIFSTFADRDHIVVVTGDEDNAFDPAKPTKPDVEPPKDAGAPKPADGGVSAPGSGDSGPLPERDGGVVKGDGADAGSAEPTDVPTVSSPNPEPGNESPGQASPNGPSPAPGAGSGSETNSDGGSTGAAGCSSSGSRAESGWLFLAGVLWAASSARKRRTVGV
jgi:hypothetical protein